MRLFKKKQYIKLAPTLPPAKAPSVPDGLWTKCTKCKKIVYTKELNAYKICPHCGYHFRLGAKERLLQICDADSLVEWDTELVGGNPISYPEYPQIIANLQEKTGLQEAVVTGRCTIDGFTAVVGVMDSFFMMGSMGSIVGEKVTRAIERATEEKLPVILFTASGGARMQEGIVSLMQMAKTSMAIHRHSEAGLLYISVLTDPTTGGVSASFASLGDIMLSEPGATIGFAGRRVIEGTLGEKLPEEFQTSEFQLAHGFLDKIVHRTQMKETLAGLLSLHQRGSQA